MGKKLFLLAALLTFTAWANAQVRLSAHADKTNLTLDDELTFTVEVSGVSGNIVMPQLPSLPAFNVYSREMEQSTVNGASTLTFRYVMVPRFVGNATIGSVQFNYNGQTYKTDPISVHIYRNPSQATDTAVAATTTASAPAAPQPATPAPTAKLPALESALVAQASTKAPEPFFLVSAVSDKVPYVNEPFTLAVRFYFSRSFYDAPYQKPTVSNLFMEEENPVEGSQQIGNTLYRYQEQRYRLSAAAPGKATIGPASVRYKVGSSALSALDRLFGGAAAIGPEKTALSAPITLYARALPEKGKPDSFYGAVGRGYTLHAQASPQEVQAGQAVNLTVTVKGTGNLKTTQNLEFPPMDGFKIYPSAADPNNAAQGYKTFKAVLVPAASGIYTIPSIEWSYFDPVAISYKTLHTDPISLTVTPAKEDKSGFDFSNSTTVGNGFQTLGSDVSYLKMTFAPAENLLEHISHYPQANWAAGLLVILGALFTALARRPLARKKAFINAKNLIKKASSSQELSDAISTYLQQKWQLSTGSLPLREMAHQLRQKGVDAATCESFCLLWQDLEAARFAPAHTGEEYTSHAAQQALTLLKLIEEQTR